MESNCELNKIDIKNCTCHFNDIIKIEDFNFDNIFVDQKSYENLLVSKISYKTFIGAKPMYIRFDKVHGFIKVYDGTKYVKLFDLAKYHETFNSIRYLIGVKSDMTFVISHNYAEIKGDSFDSLPLGKTLTFHNVIILIRSIFIKDKNNYYYYYKFLEKRFHISYLKITIIN